MSTSVPSLLPLAMSSTPPELDELKMNFRELVKSEDDAMSLLRKHQVLATHVNCPGKKGLKCGAIMKERKRKNRSDVWRCPQSTCRKELSVRASCTLFSSRTSTMVHRTVLPMNEVLEIMYMFVNAPTKLRDAASFLNYTPRTIMSW